MKSESVVGVVASVVAATLLLAPAIARAADPAGAGPVGKSAAVKLESIPGSTAKRVILSARAAERLGIETGKVGEEPVVRRQMVSGLIILPLGKPLAPTPPSAAVAGPGALLAPKPPSAGFADFRIPAAPVAAPAPKPVAVPVPLPVAAPAALPATGEVWVLVTLSPGELDRLAKDKPARLLPLATRDQLANEVLAKPTGMAPLEDMKRSMLSLYYVVPGKDHGLAVNTRMRVELQLTGSEAKQKVVPYGAVYYDAKGNAWVYVNRDPLAFERERIGVERIVGDLAVLSEGPPVGTSVVTVGAALLYGAEIFGK